jgi:TrmH family RNA methyltransferase
MAISRGEIKWVKALHSKKGRREIGCFIAEGKKCVTEALSSQMNIRSIFSFDPSEFNTHAVQKVSEDEMRQMTALANPSPHLAVIETPESPDIKSIHGKTLILDGIADPGNAGTLIRTADWFGMNAIILMENSVEWTSPKVIQSSMGSVFRMPLIPLTYEQVTAYLKSRNSMALGADLNGESIQTISWDLVSHLIIGSESQGISKELKACCHRLVTIPGKGGAESLNAAVAAGILMSHWAS